MIILRLVTLILAAVVIAAPAHAGDAAAPLFGPEQYVRAGGIDISVPGYSVPSFVLWDGDDLPDLVVGQGSGIDLYGMVRVYLNRGTHGSPLFTDWFFVQAGGGDLQSPGGG